MLATAPLVNACVGLTTTAIPRLAVSSMSSNARVIWSVCTYVPAIIATPSRIAIAVSAERSLRWPDAAQRERGHADRLEVVEDLLDREVPVLVHDEPVGEEELPVRGRRRAGVVGDHDDRLAELVDRVAQQVEHLAAGCRVEVAGRLVGEHHRGATDERACDGDALLLPARELRRPVRAAVTEARPSRSASRASPDPAQLRASLSGSTMFSSALRTGSRL